MHLSGRVQDVAKRVANSSLYGSMQDLAKQVTHTYVCYMVGNIYVYISCRNSGSIMRRRRFSLMARMDWA